MNEFIEGMHRVGEAMSAVISAQVTKDAQDRKLALEMAKAKKEAEKKV